MLWQVIVAMEAGTVLASSLLYLLALHAGRGLVERYGRFIGVGRVTDDAVEIRYVIPTTEASTHTHFCQLRTDYFKCVLDRLESRDPRHRRVPTPWLVRALSEALRLTTDQSEALLRGRDRLERDRADAADRASTSVRDSHDECAITLTTDPASNTVGEIITGAAFATE